jgi:cell division transport system ATP-binding protein
MIQLTHVSKLYRHDQAALADVSLGVEKGEFVFLTGPSGAGKTTLLRLLFREEIPSEGQVWVDGENLARLRPSRIPYLRRRIGIVFQDFRLLARRTVFENITFVQRFLGTGAREQKEKALRVLKTVGLAHKMHAFPAELSGGEQQRVAIARAVINEPVLLLADEPTGNLDAALSFEILDLFREINSHGTTILIATHDLDLLQRLPRRVLRLERGRLVDDRRPAPLPAVL